MPKVLMLRNPATSIGCKLSEGEEGNVSKELAETLVKLRLATLVDDEQEKKIEAVAKTPEIGKAKS